jgi:hypothetical protein
MEKQHDFLTWIVTGREKKEWDHAIHDPDYKPDGH